MTRVLLADLGDLDAAAVVPALAEQHGAAVITLTLDVGQQGGTASSRARALAAGAVRAHVIDAREEFARGYLLPLLRAGALRADALHVPRALLRALTAAKLLEVAAMEGATHVAHGWPPETAAADHLARTIAHQRPGCLVIAAGRPEQPQAPVRGGERARCVERTLWWRRLLAPPGAAEGATPAEAEASLEVTFAEGVPVALNGVEMPLVELIEAADTIAGDHGVGRVVLQAGDGDRVVPPAMDGDAPVTIIEAPAAAVLTAAHAEMARASASPLLLRLRRQIAARYAAVLEAGEWMSDARPALDAFVAEAQKRANGSVRLRLRRGRCRIAGPSPGTPHQSGPSSRPAPGAPVTLLASS